MIVSLAMLENLLQSEDIEGLHTLGAPADEYGHEAAAMQAALAGLGEGEPTNERVADALMKIWSQAFGPFSEQALEKREPMLQRLVHRILEQQIVESDAMDTYMASGNGASR